MTKGQLPANEKEAIKCMLIDPSVIKRPVLVTDSVLHFGYNEKIFQTIKK
jgi:arsenate reductase-like glutaredoxin family protein